MQVRHTGLIARPTFSITSREVSPKRCLNMLYCIDACFIGENLLENLPRPTVVRATTGVGGIHYHQARMRTVIEAMVALATSPTGFSTSELAAEVCERSGPAESACSPRPSRLRHPEAARQATGPEARPLPPIRTASGRSACHGRSVGAPRPGDSTVARRQRQANTSTQTPKPNPGRPTLRKPAAPQCDPFSWTWFWWRSRSTKDFTCDPSKMPVRC